MHIDEAHKFVLVLADALCLGETQALVMRIMLRFEYAGSDYYLRYSPITIRALINGSGGPSPRIRAPEL
jgi:hypothetical protein